MQYREQIDLLGLTRTDGIERIDDEGIISWIPADERNSDWQLYQAWLLEGNTPIQGGE